MENIKTPTISLIFIALLIFPLHGLAQTPEIEVGADTFIAIAEQQVRDSREDIDFVTRAIDQTALLPAALAQRKQVLFSLDQKLTDVEKLYQALKTDASTWPAFKFEFEKAYRTLQTELAAVARSLPEKIGYESRVKHAADVAGYRADRLRARLENADPDQQSLLRTALEADQNHRDFLTSRLQEIRIDHSNSWKEKVPEIESRIRAIS